MADTYRMIAAQRFAYWRERGDTPADARRHAALDLCGVMMRELNARWSVSYPQGFGHEDLVMSARAIVDKATGEC